MVGFRLGIAFHSSVSYQQCMLARKIEVYSFFMRMVVLSPFLQDDANERAVARTFLIRTKSEEDCNKLSAAIQECAP